MSLIRMDRFKADPATTDEMITRRHALVAAIRRATPGLVQARLTRLDDDSWLDMWQWDSRDNLRAAVTLAQSGRLPEAGAAFALVSDVTSEIAEVVDDR
ncbi:MAG: hypothetical protein ABW022_00575 [Actinoplanes sp.]